jgi:hypothetical protein
MGLLGPTSAEDIDVILRRVRAEWPEAFFEGHGCEDAMGIEEALKLRWAPLIEFFLYKSRRTYEVWTKDGLTAEFGGEMIAVNAAPGYLAFVVDAKDSVTYKLVEDAIVAVRENRRTFGRGGK